ncbi:MAG: hypothetical protein A2V66_10885 [Ignavibacteria bacterium RBG_13_36_8]|nr:MAG: hypothetical protein A2V66_10885 [Ignavibacteria bacterium RBG_13_36_8]
MTLTQKDLNEIEQIVDEQIEEKTKNLPTKDDFYEKMDEVVGELKVIREELPVVNHHLSDHEDRIEKIDAITWPILFYYHLI